MAFPSHFLGEKKRVYWIVGAGWTQRHATEVLPGALPDGEWIPTLCERWIRIPFATPFGREPASKRVTDRCPQCALLAKDEECVAVVWDA